MSFRVTGLRSPGRPSSYNDFCMELVIGSMGTIVIIYSKISYRIVRSTGNQLPKAYRHSDQ